jgi:hypothetical protein
MAAGHSSVQMYVRFARFLVPPPGSAATHQHRFVSPFIHAAADINID